MSKTGFLFFTISLSIFIYSCGGTRHSKDKKMPGTWQAQPIVIDGKSDDWPSPYPSYDSKALVGYATSNDRDNLYVTIETGDEYTMMKILKQGLTVWIDTEGNKAQEVAIHFPIKDENDPIEIPAVKDKKTFNEAATQLHSRDLSQKIKTGLSDATQITFEGFKSCNGGYLVKEKNPCGIIVRIGIDEYKELIWEASIPFKAIYGKEHINKNDEGKPISVGIFVKGFKKPASSGDNASTAENRGGGMGGSGMRGGGMGGGGMRGGGGRGGSRSSSGTNARDAMFESTKTWKQFGIAYQ